MLSVELEEREKKTVERRIWEAKLPKLKTMGGVQLREAPLISVAQRRDLAEGGYIQRAEPVLSLGLRTGKDASVEWSLRGGLPAETAGLIYDRVSISQ